MPEPIADQNQPLATLHVIARIRWEREGAETFEQQRAHLLDKLAHLLDRMSSDSKSQYLLSGQTVLLEDLAAVRPDLLPLVVIYNASGRLAVGPWYVLVDEALVSGEALIRNLLVGRADAKRYGVNLMPVGYSPDLSGHTAQLPQILRGFGIDAAFMGLGTPIAYLPLRWEAPDGSSVLLVNHVATASVDAIAAAESLKTQRMVEPEGPFFWLDNAPNDGGIAALSSKVDVPVTQSTLVGYLKVLRKTFPDSMRPALKGELRLQGLRENSYLSPGTLSARLYLKQANARLQARLTHAAEPWLALALTHGSLSYPDNLKALLAYSWRLLLQNQARNALGGIGSDAAHEEDEIRSRQIEDTSGQVIDGALHALTGRQVPNMFGDSTAVVVWNPHNWALTQVVELRLNLPAGRYPARVLSPAKDEQVFGWSPDELGGTISFQADVPPVGYAAYTVELSDQEPDEAYLPKTLAGVIIGNVYGETLKMDNMQLSWNRGSQRLANLLNFYDGGDAGDAYNYCPPEPDVLAQASLDGAVKIENAALWERLTFRHRMRVAPALRADRGRDRGLKLIELSTTATFYDNVPGVFFQTTFENGVKDHRLRAHLRTGIQSDTVLADAAFGIVARKAVLDSSDSLAPNREAVISTHPMQTVCAVEGSTGTMALLARGLPEFQAVPEEGQMSLALTLVRSVGWLSRGDLRTRTAALAPALPTPGAQCERPLTAQYALLALPTANHSALLRAGLAYNAGLQAYQFPQAPDEPRRSYLTIDGDGIVMTALKPPQTGEGWIVRLLNPGDTPIEARLSPVGKLRAARLVTLAEDAPQPLEIAEGKVTVTLDPCKIVTVRLEFE